MIPTLKEVWKRYQSNLSYLAAGLGLAVYILKSWKIIHTVTSIVYDEGGYIARGYLLASGKYWPYADYSIPLDHMPLSFLIPGYIQVLFGPGIRTGRYFSFGLGIIALIGLWIAARKLGGNWWAAIAIWVLALNPIWIESHSLGFSQVLILFFTTWAFVFLIGETKKPWQIFIASFLAGIAGMTRLNMMPVAFLLIVYVYWQHGKKLGTISLLGAIGPILILHIIFWPGILRIWAFYFPKGLIPLIDSYKFPLQKSYIPDNFTLSGWLNNPNNLIWEIIQSFWNGLERNLFIILGIVGTIALWPSRASWKTEYQRRLAIFFLTTYLILFSMHLWAAMSGTSCGFTCFKGYLMFFTNIGLFLIIISHPYWVKKMPVWRVVLTGVLTSYFLLELEHWNSNWQRELLHGVRQILKIEFPRLNSNGVPIWGIIENVFRVESKVVESTTYTLAFWSIPLAFVWIFIPLVNYALRKYKILPNRFGWILFTSLLFFSGLLTPLKSIGGELNAKQCQSDVIISHEFVGEKLQTKIPPGSKVYWAIESWLMYLYIPDIEIFPPQTMIHYRYISQTPGLTSDYLLQHGYWNQTLKEQWINEADFILVEGRYYKDEWRPRVESGELSLVDITQPVEDCRGDDSRIVILQNNEDDIVSLFPPSPELPDTIDSRFEVGFLQAGKIHREK